MESPLIKFGSVSHLLPCDIIVKPHTLVIFYPTMHQSFSSPLAAERFFHSQGPLDYLRISPSYTPHCQIYLFS